MNTHMYFYTNTQKHMCIHTTNTQTHIHIYKPRCIHASIHTCAYIHIQSIANTSQQTNIHTMLHTNKYGWFQHINTCVLVCVRNTIFIHIRASLDTYKPHMHENTKTRMHAYVHANSLLLPCKAFKCCT